jgi:hypothetical protein
VSPASRKLNSSLIYGNGMGSHGSTARRRAKADKPQIKTLNVRRRATETRARSKRLKVLFPSWGYASATKSASETKSTSGAKCAYMITVQLRPRLLSDNAAYELLPRVSARAQRLAKGDKTESPLALPHTRNDPCGLQLTPVIVTYELIVRDGTQYCCG